MNGADAKDGDTHSLQGRVSELEESNKKKDAKIAKLRENVKILKEQKHKLEQIQRAYKKQVNETHEESLFNIKMLQEHFHKEKEKVESGKNQTIRNIEEDLKRKENEADIWKAQAVKMETKYEGLISRVKTVAGFIGVAFLSWLIYIFFVAPQLADYGTPNQSALLASNVKAIMQIHWPEAVKAQEELTAAFAKHNPSKLSFIVLSTTETTTTTQRSTTQQQPLAVSLLSGVLTGEFIFPLPEDLFGLKETRRLGNTTLFLSPNSTAGLIDDVYQHLTQQQPQHNTPQHNDDNNNVLLLRALFVVRVKEAMQFQPLFLRWAETRLLEEFDGGVKKRSASLKNTCFLFLTNPNDPDDVDKTSKFINSVNSAMKPSGKSGQSFASVVSVNLP